VYYWWWEYLRCNQEYEQYCLNAINKKSKRLEKIYKDFGDIYSVTFDKWWQENYRGHVLFAETEINAPFGVMWFYDWINPEDFEDPKDRIYICIPRYHQSKQKLKKDLMELVDHFHKRKPGKRLNKKTKVAYRVLGRPNVKALKLHLNIYKCRLKHPHLPLWKVGQLANLFEEKDYLEPKPDTDSRNVMSAIVSRHLKKAKALIKNVAFGKFPDYKT